MIYLIRLCFFALAVTSASSATGQSLSDLKRLSDTVWAISFTHLDGEEDFANITRKSLPQIKVEDQTERFVPQNWSGDAIKIVGLISNYSNSDSLE